MRRVRENLVPILAALGVLLVAVGGIAVLRAEQEVSFGWFAYAPMSDTTFSPGVTALRTSTLWAWASVVTGSVLLVGTIAYIAGVRRGRRDGAGPDASAQEPTDG
jgi:heme/copper-type cytochrome/quinol oxidase subunit 1